MVLLFVNQAADHDSHKRIYHQQNMIVHTRNRAIDGHDTHILDRAVHRVEQENTLNLQRIAVHLIENRRKIMQQRQKDVVQILGIPEKHLHRRENQAHADAQQHQADNRIQKRDKMPAKPDAIQRSKQEKDQHGQAQIDERGDILG